MAAADQRPGIRPRASIGHHLDAAAWAGVPACSTILLMLSTQVPMEIPGQAVLLPAVALCGVWLWSLARPTALPPSVVFLIGLLLDLLGFLPLGVGGFTLLLVRIAAVVMRRRLAGRGLLSIWLTFAAVATAAALVMWLMVMLLTFRWLSPDPMIFLGTLAAAVFPLLAVPFGASHRPIIDPGQE